MKNNIVNENFWRRKQMDTRSVSISRYIKIMLLSAVPFLASFTVSQASRRVSIIASLLAKGGTTLSQFYADSRLQDKDLVKEALDALQNCSQQYLELKKFTMDVEYTVFYDSEDFDNPADRRTGKIIRDKNNFYQEEMGNIRVVNAEHELIIKNNTEFMMIRNRTEKEIQPAVFAVDSLSTYVNSAEHIKGGYSYYFEEGSIEKMELVFDAAGYLKTWRTWYRDKMNFGSGEVKVITQMSYLNFNKRPKTNPSFFALDRFVDISDNGEITARGAYKDYFLLNQLSDGQ